MKQTSLFRIAKQLKIPEWIVGLRHNAAHGHELQPLGVLRIAINVLLEWLHEEYWAPEASAMEKRYAKKDNTLEEEEDLNNIQAFGDLIELWTSVGLYVHAGYKFVLDLPDENLQETLQDLQKYVLSNNNRNLDNIEDKHIQIDKDIKNTQTYTLRGAQTLLVFEISAYLSKNLSVLERNDTICKVLCGNRIFLPDSDIIQIFLPKGQHECEMNDKLIPPSMLQFWKDIIILLHKKELLKVLIFKLVDILNEKYEIKERKTYVALWLNTIIHSFIQLDLAQNVCRTMEYELGKQLSTKDLSQRVKVYIHSKYPYLQDILWIDISSTVPCFLLDTHFMSKLLLSANEFSVEFIKSLLKFFTPDIDENTKRYLLNVLKIYTSQEYNNDENHSISEKIYTVDNLRANMVEHETLMHEEKCNEDRTCLLADKTIRNLHWKAAFDTYQWTNCPIGLLPWQDSLESLELLKPELPNHSAAIMESQIIAGIVNNKNLKMKSRINWKKVLQMKRGKRKRDEDVAHVILKKALETAKKQDYLNYEENLLNLKCHSHI
ncbi:uncharacterized protein LOC105192510 isoform X2 [Harpegnathos saltator]|nr:uncharacterized protein LOC105192510 isoform X2 [Harpegnathos saltator]XP_011154992.1 uncharacterized protein LOC105192510 isoform X2 [Harpegnathos saltator]